MTRAYNFETNGNQYDSITEAIVRAVAAVRDEEVTDVVPLYAAIDPEALEQLLENARDATVTFEYAELAVTIDSSRRIRVEGTADSTSVDSETSE